MRQSRERVYHRRPVTSGCYGSGTAAVVHDRRETATEDHMNGVVLAGCTAASLLLLPAEASAQTKTPPAGTWTMKAHMAEPRGELAVTVLDGRIYALAGAAQGYDA